MWEHVIFDQDVEEWADKLKNTECLILADYSADNVGRSCGDHIKLDVNVKDDKLFLGGNVQACLFTKASMAWMIELLNGKDIDFVYKCVSEFKSEIQKPINTRSSITGPWMNKVLDQNKVKCVMAPWEAMTGIVKKIISETDMCNIDLLDESQGLSCDACVVTKKIKWLDDGKNKNQQTKDTSEETKTSYQIIKNLLKKAKINSINKFSDHYLSLQRFGKVVLRNKEIIELRDFIEGIDTDTIDNLRRMRFLGILEYHCNQSKINIKSSELPYYFTRAHCKTSFHNRIIAEIQDLIDKNDINAVFIKGSKTKNLYPVRGMRYSNDLDILTHDMDNLLKLCSCLIQHLGFQFSLDNGVVFSTKYILENEKVRFLGHLHLKKMKGTHKLNIDISFPGMPIGMLDATHFPELHNKTISYNDQFIITLSHLLKHEIPYIKDINDLYLMVKNKTLDNHKVLSLIKKYKLMNVSYLTMKFVINEIDETLVNNELVKFILNELNLKETRKYDKILGKGWPYTIESHYLLQQCYLFESNYVETGNVLESLELLNNITSIHEKKYPVVQINNIDFELNKRYYWIPVVMFKNTIDVACFHRFSGNQVFSFEGDSLYFKFDGFALVLNSLGIFLFTDTWGKTINKENIVKKVKYIFRALELSYDDLIIVRSVNED